MDIPLQIGENKEKAQNNTYNYNNDQNYILNTEESLPKTDYKNNNHNNHNNNTNVFNNLNSNFTHLDTYPRNSVDMKSTDYTSNEIGFNNTPISNTFRRNKETESKEETLGYLKNLKEEMKKFTEFNFDFENLNVNKTPEFKEVNKYNHNYQLNDEINQNNTSNNNSNNNYVNDNSSPYEYNCTYTLHNENNNNSNKDIVYDISHDSFCNNNDNNLDNTRTNTIKNNPILDTVNFSKMSNNSKLANLDFNTKNDMVKLNKYLILFIIQLGASNPRTTESIGRFKKKKSLFGEKIFTCNNNILLI